MVAYSGQADARGYQVIRRYETFEQASASRRDGWKCHQVLPAGDAPAGQLSLILDASSPSGDEGYSAVRTGGVPPSIELTAYARAGKFTSLVWLTAEETEKGKVGPQVARRLEDVLVARLQRQPLKQMLPEATPALRQAMLRVSDVGSGSAIRRSRRPADATRFAELHICDVDSSFSDVTRQTVLIRRHGQLAAAERVTVERDGLADRSIDLKLGLLSGCEYGLFTLRGRPLLLPSGLGDEAAGLRFHLSVVRSDKTFDPQTTPAVLDVVLVRMGSVLTELVLPGKPGTERELSSQECDILHAALARVRAALPKGSATG